MLFLWKLYFLLPLSLPVSLHVTGKNVRDPLQPDAGTATQRLTPSPQRHHGSGSANPVFGTMNADFLGLPVSWSLHASEELDRQGVIGEYTDLQENTETSLSNEKERIISRSSDTEDAKQPIRSLSPPQPTQDETSKSTETSILHSTQTGESQPTFPTLQNEKTDSNLPFPPSDTSHQDTISPQSAGATLTPKYPTPPVMSQEWTTGPPVVTQQETVPVKETGDKSTDITSRNIGVVSMEADQDDSKDADLHLSKTGGRVTVTSATSCKTSNQSWTPAYPDDLTPNESLRPALALSPALFVPLYSDWNSALATWGFAWEAHVYGLGSVFILFGLISVVCLLGLPLRCPPGGPYFTLLHLFLLAFAGIQAFCLLYDAYNHQDRLPPLGTLLLSELPFPCLISAFSLTFILLSSRSRMHFSLPLANSTLFSALPKPSLLLCMSLFYSVVSLGCVGMLQLFHSLPSMILLFPQGVFVCLTIFLSCSYLIFYCLMQCNTKHIYRLNDNGEGGGSPEVMRPTRCPFAKVEDWGRAAGAGVGASLCLLGCGGLQLYGILHALGLGGVDGYGFQPWPWWGYQIGCRLCEAGVCLGLSLIGSYPLFCQKNSPIKIITPPRPGSWSRLSCGSPSRGLTLPSQGAADSPVLTQGKQEKLVVCDVITKGQSEVLPLFSMADPPGNGIGCVPKSSQTRSAAIPLPTPPSPPRKPKESQPSSLDSLGLGTDSSVDLRPPSPIDLSRSIDQALFSESLFSHSIFGLPRLFHASSNLSLNSPSQGATQQGLSSVDNALYRTSSCCDVDALSSSRPQEPHNKSPVSPGQWDWKESGSTQGLCNNAKEAEKLTSHSWANRGQNFAQSSLPRAIPHLSYHRRYRTLSLASQDSRGSGRLAGTKHLSESKQLEWDLAVQAEFVNVCRQIDTLSVCSDTIEL